MTLSLALHAVCAALYVALAASILIGTRPDRTSYGLAGCCVATACWAAVVAFDGASSATLVWLGLVPPAAWFAFVVHVYRRTTPAGSRLGGILSVAGGLTILAAAVAAAGQTQAAAGIEARLGLAVCAILLIENLYRNAPEELRWHLSLPCVALGGLFAYDVLLYSDAALFRRVSPALLEGRTVVLALLTPLLGVAAWRNRRRWGLSLHISHNAVFYSASLVVLGVFLLALAATGEVLRQFGSGRDSDWGTVLEVSLVCGGVLTGAVFATSGSARSSLRHLVINNFLSHRYDYRLEWLRCIKTLAQADSYVALHTRVIKAVAQIVDSPAGVVFLREAGDGVFRCAGSWNLPAIATAIPAAHPLVPLFRGGIWVVEAPAAMPWAEELDDLWLAVPLNHAGELMGFTLVARPRAPFTLDGEVFALLRIVGQEVASYIAEQRAAEALLQTRQLREYGQRFAFVAHDIKNVASQLALLLANAEHHISNPEFQRDMLGTVGASVNKITALLARLKAGPEDLPAGAVVVQHRIEAAIAACSPGRRARIQLTDAPREAAAVTMPEGALDAVLIHLLNNAFEASPPGAPVQVGAACDGGRVVVDIVDHGSGMSAEFIRDRLFRPFASSKQEGSGIGVYQARELLRRAAGDLLVTSALGAGTTMRVSLPLAPVGRLQ